jgi:hypothetical protein
VAHALEVFGTEPEFNETFLVGDAFAANKRCLGLLDLAQRLGAEEGIS